MRLTRVFAATALGIAVALSPGSRAAEPLVLRARAFDGTTWREALRVEIGDDGRIARVSDDPAGAASSLLSGVLTPGFLDLDSRLGLGGGDAEEPEALAADLRLADSFAPDASEADALRRSGITTAWLAGGAGVVLAGSGATVQPAAARGLPVIVRAAWGASASLSTAARQDERAPTSLPEQARELTASLVDMHGPARIRFDDGASARLAALLGLPVGLPTREADLVELAGAPGLVASADWAGLRADALRPLAAWLAQGQLGLGSAGSALGPAALRVAAARLIEEGAEPDRVLRSLTSDGAALLGDPARGRIAPGAAADLVLWDGDPLSLASRPLVIWIAGQEVHRAE